MKKLFKLFGLAAVITAIAFNALLITGCNGGGDSTPVFFPPPEAKYDALYLYAQRWETSVGRGENWNSYDQVHLSDFSAPIKPKRGDVLSFKISGVSDVELKYIRFEIFSHDRNEDKWIGGSDLADLSTSFNNYSIEASISEEPIPNASIYIQIANVLWHENTAANYFYVDNKIKLADDVEDGAVMATIKNFKISLVSTAGNNSGNGWWKYNADASPARLDFSVDGEGVCTINVTGSPDKDRWNAVAGYSFAGKAGTNYEYTFEAWTKEGTRDLYLQYYEDNNESVYMGASVSITTVQTTYTVTGGTLPKTGDALRFQCGDKLGTLYIKILNIKEFKVGKLTITNFSGILNQNNYIDGYISIYSGSAYRQLYAGTTTSQVTQIKGDTITMSMWDVERDDDGKIISSAPFIGSTTVEAGAIWINHMYSNGMDGYINTAPITFTNGDATIDFKTQMNYVTPGEENSEE